MKSINKERKVWQMKLQLKSYKDNCKGKLNNQIKSKISSIKQLKK